MPLSPQMPLPAAVTEFFYSKDFTTDSLRFYKRTLAAFTQWAETQGVTNVSDITAPLLRRYVASVRERIAPRTGLPLTGVSVFNYANALRTFLNFCEREGWLDEKVVRRLEMPRKEKKVLQVLSIEQIRLLFRACDASTTPERDRALLGVLLETGVRVAELCKLRLDDVHFEQDTAWLKVQGKGRREREVPLGRTARRALHRYIHSTRRAPSTLPYALLGKRGQLTQAGVDKMLYALRDAAGAHRFVGVQVSAHTMRRTFATRFLEAGGDIYHLSRLLGHSSVSTTELYVAAYTQRQVRESAVSILDLAR